MENNVILTIVLACSIPATLFGAFIGILIWVGQRKAIKRENERCDREKNRDKMFLFMFEGNDVSIHLGKVHAEAHRDGKVNGNVDEALKRVEDFKRRREVFFNQLGIEHLST